MKAAEATMPRGEERVERVLLMMEMMHLMVCRRQVPKKKTLSSGSEIKLNDGLVTIGLEREVSGGLPSPRNDCEEAEGRAEGFEQAHRETANLADGDGNGDDRSSSTGKGRHRRSTGLERKHLHRIRLGPTLTTSLSFHETRTTARIREKPTADECAGKFAYISLDGRLVNAELATRERTIGGALGDAEARASEDFVPMQRVLIVAVSAAAAAAAKNRNRGEMDTLLKTVEKQVPHRRQHRILSAIALLCNIILSSLHTFFCTLITTMSTTSLWSLQKWSGMLTSRRKLRPSMWSRENEFVSFQQKLTREVREQIKLNVNDCEPIEIPEPLAVGDSSQTPVQEPPSAVVRGRFDGDDIKVNLNLQEAWSSAKPRAVSELRDEGEFDEFQLSRDSPVSKDVVFAESSTCRSDVFNSSAFQVGDETSRAKGEAKWYVNPMVEISEDFYFTPERCNPAVQSVSEWEGLRSSFGYRETHHSTGLSPTADSALGTPTQTAVSDSNYQTILQTVVDDSAVYQEHVAMRAWCAAIIFDLREQMLSVLDKEAAMAIDALDTNVKDAKSHLESLHLALASCWNASMPKVLAALRLSPSELDSWLLNEAQGASTRNETPKSAESIVAWRQYLEKIDMSSEDAGRKFNTSESAVPLSGADGWLARSAYPRYTGQSGRTGVLGGGLVRPRVPSEDLADQLLAESDKAITSEDVVIGSQMNNMGQDIVVRDDKQIWNRSGSTNQDWENQAKGCEDVAVLGTKLQSNEVKVADLKKGQQVQKSRVCQSPDVQRGHLYFAPSTPSPSSGNGTLQNQRFSDKHAPSALVHDPALEHIKKEVPSYRAHVRNSPCTNTQRHQELADDGRSDRGYDHETTRDYSPPLESTIGDDCSFSSHAIPETAVESHLRSEIRSSSDDLRYRSFKDRLSGATGSSDNRTPQKQKSAASDLRRSVSSPASGGRGLTRTQSTLKNFRSTAPGSKSAVKENYSTKPSQRTCSSEVKKVIKDPNSPQSCNLKVVRSVAANYCRSSSLDINMCATLETSGVSVGLSDGRVLSSQEKSATKRKRWV